MGKFVVKGVSLIPRNRYGKCYEELKRLVKEGKAKEWYGMYLVDELELEVVVPAMSWLSSSREVVVSSGEVYCSPMLPGLYLYKVDGYQSRFVVSEECKPSVTTHAAF